MPEPDFEQIARDIADLFGEIGNPSSQFANPDVVEQLRQVWNARGAADARAVDVEARHIYTEATRTGRDDLVVDLVKVIGDMDR